MARQRGKPFDLEYVLREKEGNANCRSLTCVAHDGRVLASAGGLQVQVQRLQGNRTRRASFELMRLCLTQWKLHREPTLPAGSMPGLVGETAPCNDEEKLGQ